MFFGLGTHLIYVMCFLFLLTRLVQCGCVTRRVWKKEKKKG